MNFLYGLFFSPPENLSIQQQIEWKKEALGISPQDELHKLVMGFFLDQVEGIGDEKKVLEDLSRFEWFAGSVSGARLRLELESFLMRDSAHQLDPATVNQIKTVIGMLQRADEQSSLIDLIRSGSFALPLLAITGNTMWQAESNFAPDENKRHQLVENAITQVSSLQNGEKTLFLVGTLTHETILVIEKIREDAWEVSYYDTALNKPLSVYQVDDKGAHFLSQEFWEEVYEYKFMSHSQQNLAAFIENLSEQESSDTLDCSKISKQKKNTCHIRCLLACLKDQIVRKSGLDLNLALLEWKKFQVLFGQHLIDFKTIENIENSGFCALVHHKQEKRRLQFEHMNVACNEQEYKSAVEAYESVFALLGKRGPFFDAKETAQSEYLNQCHIHLISILEQELQIFECTTMLINPKQLRGALKEIHPLIKYTLSVFEERYEKRKVLFKKRMQEELQFASSSLKLKTEEAELCYLSALNQLDQQLVTLFKSANVLQEKLGWYKRNENIDAVHLDEEEVIEILNLLQSHPEVLVNFRYRLGLNFVVIQGIQLGKLKEVETIYRQLEPKDKQELERLSRDERNYVPALLKQDIGDQLIHYDNCRLFEPIINTVSFEYLKANDFAGYLNFTNAFTQKYLDGFGQSWVIKEEHVLPILECLKQLHETKTEVHYSSAILGRIKEKTAPKVVELISKRRHEFENIPAFLETYNTLLALHLYQMGRFTEIQSLKMSVLPKFGLYMFTRDNYKEGVALLQFEKSQDSLSEALFSSLLISAATLKAPEILEDTLKPFCEALDKNEKIDPQCFRHIFWNLDAATRLYLLEFFKTDKRWIDNGAILEILELLLKDECTLEEFIRLNDCLEFLCARGHQKKVVLKLQECSYNHCFHQHMEAFPISFLAKSFWSYQCKHTVKSATLFFTWQGFEVRYVSERRNFLKNFEKLCAASDLSDPLAFYTNVFHPIFNKDYAKSCYLDLYQNINSFHPTIRICFALLFWQKGEQSEALQIHRDELQLKQFSLSLSLFS